MTPRAIVVLALKLSGALGVGQTALAEDINDGFTILNMMMGQFSQKRWLIYHLVDVALPMTGAQAYSIGPGGDLDTPRPDRIESAFVRMGASPQVLTGGFQLDVSLLDVTAMDGVTTLTVAAPTLRSLDYPLDVIEAREDWNRVPFKAMPGFPASIFYDSAFPVGTIYVNPVPSTQFELHLSLKQALTSFANLSSDVNLPAQYYEALLYNLALRLAPMYGLPPRPDVAQLASAALSTIRTSNVQVGRLQMPGALAGLNRGGGYGGIGFGSFAYAGFGPDTGTGTGIGTGSSNGTSSPAPATSARLGQGVLGTMILGS